MRSSRPLGVLLTAALTLLGRLPSAAAADIFYEVLGARSLAMGGAHRGLGNSNEALWLNPAGMALTHHYAMGLQYDYAVGDHHANATIVDSKSGPVAGGFSYTRDFGKGGDMVNRSHLGFAYGLGQAFALGVTVHNVSGDYTADETRQHVSDWNGTVGAMMMLGEMFSMGVTYQNFFTGQRMLPTVLGTGVGLRGTAFSMDGDLDILFFDGAPHTLTYRAGLEAFLGGVVALRTGWHYGSPDTLGAQPPEHFITAGLGAVNQGGAINLSAERALSRVPSWQVLASLEFYL